MKKLYSTIMMLAMMVAALSFTACGGGDDDDDDFGGGGKKTKNTITITDDSGDVYYSISVFDWTSEDDDINGNLTEDGTIYCFMSRKNVIDADYLHIYLENGEKSISDFPKGYDLGTPTVNFGVLRTYTNEYDYVSGSIKVSRNDGNSFTLEFNDYVAAKQSGAKITIRGNLYVEKMKYF